jgi:hypothetical protein
MTSSRRTSSRQRRGRLALVVVAIMLAAIAHAATARSSSHARVSESRESSLTLVHHADTAVVPANQLLRGSGRALDELLSAPVAGALALGALVAVWCTTSLRRRPRGAEPTTAHRRRGPPTSLPAS